MVSSTARRIDRLLEFLQADPENLNLLADAADAAFQDGRFQTTAELAGRYAALEPPPPPLVNLAGLAAMREGRFEDAAAHFEAARAVDPQDPALRYNLAWALAAQKDWAAASDLLDESVAIAVPAAATLKVQVLHHLGQVEDALAWGAEFADGHPHDSEFLGALSSAAMDAEDVELAEAYARRGGGAPEALATLGMLRLGDERIADATGCFDQALAANPASARALLGAGLARLSGGDSAGAAPLFDKAADLFGDHLGSWVAAGWAYFTVGDLARARQRFETALALDDTFAEAHGGLAVVDVLEKRFDEARRGAQTALRLDRECFSGILARTLLLDEAGEAAAATRLRDAALDAPIGPGGQTIAQALVGFTSRRKPR